MVRITKRKIGTAEYYYLEHSIRIGDKVVKEQLYLGKELPKNIEELRKKFFLELKEKKWFVLFNKIRQAYVKELSSLPESAKQKETEAFAIKFTYDTNRIEGSTLTLKETARLLQDGIAPKRPLRDIKEAESHNRLFYEMLNCKKDISMNLILEWHRKLLLESKPDIAGRIREHQVAIAGSKFLPPSPVEIYPLLKEFFSWYERNKKKLHPVELAALIHLKLVTIHPFADGNGRMSRLLMNFVLNKNGFPMLNIHYAGRDSYYNALERSQVKNMDDIFLNWFFRRYTKDNKKYILNVRT